MKTYQLQPLSLSAANYKKGRRPGRRGKNLAKSILLICCMCVFYNTQAQLSGNYTIDPNNSASSTNYKNFRSAVADLDSGKRYDGGTANGKGVSGAVIFKVATWTFYEQIEITPIPGSSASHTVTFISASGDSTQTLLTNDYKTTGANYTVSLRGASFITFEKMSIARRDGSNAVWLHDGAAYNTFSHNILSANTFVYDAIVVNFSDSGANVHNNHNVFDGNYIKKAYYAISISTHNNAVQDSFNTFKNNRIDSLQSGLNIQGQWDVNFSNNYYTDYYYTSHNQVNFSECEKMAVYNNKFRFYNSGEIVFFTIYGSSTIMSDVYNNSIINLNLNGGSDYTILFDKCNYTNFYFNSIVSGTTSYSIYGIDDNKTNSLNFENNVIYYTGSTAGPLVYLDKYIIKTMDYNAYNNAGGGFKGSYNSSLTSSLSNWQSASGYDTHSLLQDPGFYDSSIDLRLKINKLVAGTNISAITQDITGKTRGTTPTIGAYEYFAPTIVKAGFKYSFIKGNCTDSVAKVHFSDTSYTSAPGDSLSREWYIGNKLVSTDSAFDYVFHQEDTYDVLLYVQARSGSKDKTTGTVSISLLPTFVIAAGNICDTLITVNFKDSVINERFTTASSYLWNFGDGNTSTAQNPTYTYPVAKRANSFHVQLTVSTTAGCTTTVSRDLYPAKIIPKAYSLASSCGLTYFANVSSTSSPYTSKFLWNFGDGESTSEGTPSHQYHLGGTYHYNLTAYTEGCARTFEDSVVVSPYVFVGGYFKVTNNCVPDSVVFDDSSYTKFGTPPLTYTIDFGDSSTPLTSFAATYSHKFPGASTYTVTHTVTDATGCSNFYTQTIEVRQDVSAYFVADRLCQGMGVFTRYDDTITSPGYTRTWDFGDGDTSGHTSRRPYHAYKKNGTYGVKLTVSNGSCTTSSASSITIDNIVLPDMKAPAAVCLGDSFQISGANLIKTSGVNFEWGFEGETYDSTLRDKKDIKHAYTKPGNHIIYFYVLNHGCQDAINVTVFADSTCVWPGDADYNKKVNIKDILPIGLAYGKTGYTRPNASLTWQQQGAQNWSSSFKSGVNYKHADCNGDGKVDTADARAIIKNWGKTHLKSGAPLSGNPTDPPLTITFSKDSIQAGDTVQATVALGSAAINANDVYGLTLSLNYKSSLVKSISGDFTKSWLGTINKDLFYLVMDNGNGTLDVGISRNDQKDVSGYGKIAVLSIIMTDNIAGKREVKDMLKLDITDYKAISADETTLLLNPSGDSIEAYQYVGIDNNQPDAIGWQIYPNPANNILHIKTLNAEIRGVQITDLLGKTVYTSPRENTTGTDIPVSSLSKGMYIIDITTAKGNIRTRFVKE